MSAQYSYSCGLSGSTRIHTDDGIYPVGQLLGRRPALITHDPATANARQLQAEGVFICGYDRGILRLCLEGDYGEEYLDCTPNHRVMMADGYYRPAGDLAAGDELRALTERVYSQENLKHLSAGAPTEPTTRPIVVNLGAGAAQRERTAVMRAVLGHLYERSGGESPTRTGQAVVSAIEELGVAREVYGISMPALHNFAAGGVFVHNCEHHFAEKANGAHSLVPTFAPLPHTASGPHGSRR